jgi:DNA modification methylase
MLDTLFNEDCSDTMKRIPNGYVDGIITSPPYNINVERSDCYYDNGYSHLDSLSEKDYLSKRCGEFLLFSNILKQDGVICYNLSYSKENPVLPSLLVSDVHNRTDFTLADIICWKKNSSIPFQTSPTKLSRITELIYVFVNKTFLHSFTTNKEVSKINATTGQKFYKNYTNFIEAKNNDGFKSSLKAAYSVELCDKLIDIYFPEGSIIYDPFSGIGTTQISCKKNKCRYIGSEIIKDHFDNAIGRLS